MFFPTVNFRDVEFATPNYVDLQLTGLLGLPALESHDLPYSTRDGVVPGEDYARGKTITFSGVVIADDDITFGQAIENLRFAFEQREFERDMFFSTYGLAGGRQVSLKVRPRQMDVVLDENFVARRATFSVQLFATDALFYAALDDAADTSSVAAGLTTAGSTGHGFNHGFNLGFGGGGSSAIICTNTGNAETYPTITFFGPLVNPHIRNQNGPSDEDGLSFEITLGVSDFLVIDTNRKTVTLNGTANRYDTILDSDWFVLYPGDNSLTFSVASTTGSPSVTIAWRDAWI